MKNFTEALCNVIGFLRSVGDLTLGGIDTVLSQELDREVFVDVEETLLLLLDRLTGNLQNHQEISYQSSMYSMGEITKEARCAIEVAARKELNILL